MKQSLSFNVLRVSDKKNMRCRLFFDGDRLMFSCPEEKDYPVEVLTHTALLDVVTGKFKLFQIVNKHKLNDISAMLMAVRV